MLTNIPYRPLKKRLQNQVINFKRISMKQKILILSILCVFSACMTNTASKEQTAYFQSFRNKPLTFKEKQFIEKIKELGIDSVDIQPPTIGVDAQGSSSYSIALYSNKGYKHFNHDSLQEIRTEIVYELYRNVIEDSIIYDLGDIILSCYKNKNSKRSEIYDNWAKQYLEEDLGFRVVKKGKDNFSRVKI